MSKRGSSPTPYKLQSYLSSPHHFHSIPFHAMKTSTLIFKVSLIFALVAVFLLQVVAQRVGDGHAPCSKEDMAALLSFKSSILEDGTGILSSWAGDDCCSGWEGVSCDLSRGKVVELKLEMPASGYGPRPLFMRGTLSPALGRLKSLQILQISGAKKLGGAIPESFSGLSSLVELILDDNLLSGSIPSGLGRLASLAVLSLSGNKLTGQLPPSLGYLKLAQVNLAGNLLAGPVPSTFGNFKALEFLDLSRNQLSGGIPSFMGGYQNLTNLDLSYNQFSGAIPSSLCRLSVAMEISLDSNKLTGQIPNQIGDLQNLRSLSVSNNLLSGSIPYSLGKLKKLWRVILSGNRLSGPVPREVQNGLPVLQSLHLSHNDFHLQTIPDWIRRRELREVHLAGCNIRSSLEPFAFPGTIDQLDLSDNYLTGEIGDFFTNMSVLQTLDLHSNQLAGSLSELLQKASGLVELDMSNNRITGGLPEFDNGLRLQRLELSSNQISGGIPSSIWKLKSLQRLDLSRNRIEGGIPASLGQITTLEWLDISNNMINGSIPSTFSSLVKIKHVSFRANRLCGQVPQSRPFNIFPPAAYAHNLCLCGRPLPPCEKPRLNCNK